MTPRLRRLDLRPIRTHVTGLQRREAAPAGRRCPAGAQQQQSSPLTHLVAEPIPAMSADCRYPRQPHAQRRTVPAHRYRIGSGTDERAGGVEVLEGQQQPFTVTVADQFPDVVSGVAPVMSWGPSRLSAIAINTPPVPPLEAVRAAEGSAARAGPATQMPPGIRPLPPSRSDTTKAFLESAAGPLQTPADPASRPWDAGISSALFTKPIRRWPCATSSHTAFRAPPSSSARRRSCPVRPCGVQQHRVRALQRRRCRHDAVILRGVDDAVDLTIQQCSVSRSSNSESRPEFITIKHQPVRGRRLRRAQKGLPGMRTGGDLVLTKPGVFDRCNRRPWARRFGR